MPAFLGACSTSGSATPVADAGLDAAVTGLTLSLPCADTIDSVYGDPGALPATAGAIIRCAHDKDVDRAALESAERARVQAYVGAPFTSGARIFRVLYRTERGNDAKTPGYSSALVLVPDTPRAPSLPAIVVGHATFGQAKKCTPSQDTFPKDDASAAMIFPLVGAGYAVIVPDYAGYANYGAAGNPPSGYAASDDVAKSMLDAARALRVLLPQVSSKLVIVGHSQGGHTALSTAAKAAAYAPELSLSATVAYSPLWFSEATWAALLFVSASHPIADNTFATSVGLWYHYSHGELLDGPGHGLDPFAASKRADIKAFFDNVCLADNGDAVKKLGTFPIDLYDPAFASSVKAPAATGSDCAGDPVCATWIARYAADRPHLTGAAASAPLLVLYGMADDTITPDRATCGFERLRADMTNLSICVVPGQTHAGIVGNQSGYVNDWIANVALGGPAPAKCMLDDKALKDDAGAQVTCATPPPND